MSKVVYDIETLRELFLYCDYNIESKEKNEFEISHRKNDLYSFVKYLKEADIQWHISFNGLNFDIQVIQYILDNYEQWIDLKWNEIVLLIYDFAQDVIDSQNYDLPLKYREEHLDIQQVDLFQIHHYSNKARRTSLKWLEFGLDMNNIEVMPIYHGKLDLSVEEIEETIRYCWNDIEATYKFYLLTIGETENELYKGKNKIQDRLDLIDELGFTKKCINYSDVKIGDEINKAGYKALKRIDNKKLYELKKYRKSTKGFTFGDCIPKYVEFQTKEFKDLYNSIKDVIVNLNTKQKFHFTYGNTTYSIMKGGIHSEDKARRIIKESGFILRDADVGSQYPNAIVKRNLYPSHLGKEWLHHYKKTIHKRLEYKDRGKGNSKYKGLAETFKLALNGGGFGKTNERENWQYDPFVMFQCTIGNQFEMLMLIESLELSGISVISANTDGIVCYFKKELEEDYKRICNEWEKKVGNDEMGKLEFSDFQALIQTSVNDYIAILENGEVKLKGDFQIYHELHKNKSRKIIPLALKEYFVNGKLPEDTINNHRNIFDFCIGVKASSNFYYEGINRNNGEVKKYDKLIRYYVSTEGEKLYKVKKEGVDTKAPERRECEAGVPYQTLFNTAVKYDNFDDYKVNKDYYISKVYDMIYKITPLIKKDRFNKENGILTLF